MSKTLFRLIVRVAFILIAAFLIKNFFIHPFLTFDSGMAPSLKENRIYFINKLIYRLRSPDRKEIIFFRTTEDPPLFFIGRIVGLPGETFKIKKGRVFINGDPLKEDYTQLNLNWNLKERQIERKCFYVLGDSRQMDLANHLHAQVAGKNILGKVMGRR